jgi:SAM-dependent methyltransferase
MIENYRITQDGVIEQINKQPFAYGSDYSAAYNKLGEKINYMSYLRLGYIAGALSSQGYNNIQSILDVGYGNGSFLAAASKFIPNCFGTDISESYPLPVNCKFVNNFDGYYDVITFFDALEHFNDIEFVKNLNCKYVCITVPQCHNNSDEWFESWKNRKPNEHIWHFNSASLTTFMKRMGYTCISMCNIEDAIRDTLNNQTNILTGVFAKNG